jgi:uncharacterized protein (TIGR02145 family)
MKKSLPLSSFIPIAIISNSYAQTWTCGDTLVDPRDGKMYITVPIGSDCWMAENLNYGQYVASIYTGTPHADVANDGNVQKYCQNNDSMNCITYGGLYDWNELMNYTTTNGTQGICPPGWHIATDAEWQAMILASGGTFSGNVGTGANDLKALGEGVGADTGTNASGFTARSGGDRSSLGEFYGMGVRFIFWTSTNTSLQPYQYSLWMENDSIYRYNDAQKESGFSCRCVKDASTMGMNETNSPSVSLAPNPAQESVTLQLPGTAAAGTFSIFNAAGQLVQSGTLNQNSTTLSVAALPSGYYFITVNTGETEMRSRFVVIHP